MKISDLFGKVNNYSNAKVGGKHNAADGTENKYINEEGSDRTTISPKAVLLAQVSRINSEDEVSRAERVQALKEKVANGEYSLSTDNNVELELINSSGATIKLVQMGLQGAGVHAVSLDMKNIQPGLYYCRVKTKDSIFTKRILLKKNLHEMH